MKKIIVIVISLIIISISLMFINKLLNPREEKVEEKNTTVSYGEYSLFNFDDNVNVYSLKDPSNFHILVQNINLDYQDGNILIVDKEFDEVLKVYSYFAIYDDSVVVMAYKDINNYSHIVIYNTYLKELDIIDELDSFYVNIDEDIIFENIGIIVNTSKIFENKLMGTNTNICKIKDKNMTINQTYEIYYDMNNKKFTKNEVLYSTNLYSYINNNNLCKE